MSHRRLAIAACDSVAGLAAVLAAGPAAAGPRCNYRVYAPYVHFGIVAKAPFALTLRTHFVLRLNGVRMIDYTTPGDKSYVSCTQQ